jgi:hypothetical protein
MLVLVLTSLLMLATGRWLAVFPALALAILVKATAVLVGPILALVAAREVRARRLSPRLLVASFGLASMVLVAGYAPAWAGPKTLGHIVGGVGLAMNSPVAAVAWVLRRFAVDAQWVIALARPAGLAIVAIGMVVVLVRLWRRPWVVPEEVLRAAFDMVALYLMVGAAWFLPWYVTWLLALAAVIDHPGRQRAAAAFSVLVLGFAIVPAPELPGVWYYSHVAVVVIAFGTFVGLLGWAAWSTGTGPLASAWRSVTRRVPVTGVGRPAAGGD